VKYTSNYYYATANVRVDPFSNYIGILTAAKHLVKKKRIQKNEMMLVFPESITLYLKTTDKQVEEYQFNLHDFEVHPRYLDSYNTPYGYRIAVGVADLSLASPQIKDLEEFKNRLAVDMPNLTKKYRHSKNDTFKIIVGHQVNV